MRGKFLAPCSDALPPNPPPTGRHLDNAQVFVPAKRGGEQPTAQQAVRQTRHPARAHPDEGKLSGADLVGCQVRARRTALRHRSVLLLGGLE